MTDTPPSPPTPEHEAAERAARKALVLSVFVPPVTLVTSILALNAAREAGTARGQKEATAALVNSAIGSTLLVGLIIAIPFIIRFLRAQLVL